MALGAIVYFSNIRQRCIGIDVLYYRTYSFRTLLEMNKFT